MEVPSESEEELACKSEAGTASVPEPVCAGELGVSVAGASLAGVCMGVLSVEIWPLELGSVWMVGGCLELSAGVVSKFGEIATETKKLPPLQQF